MPDYAERPKPKASTHEPARSHRSPDLGGTCGLDDGRDVDPWRRVDPLLVQAWKDAQHELKQAGQLESVKRPDLFHQCRYEWNRLGLAGVDEEIAKLDERRRQFESTARSWGRSPDKIANLVAAWMGAESQEPSYFKRSNNPKQTAEEFGSEYYDPAVPMGDARELATMGLSIRCTLMLGTDGESVYATRFHYHKTGGELTGDLFRTPS